MEEQFVLRVVDAALADRLRSALREEASLNDQLKLSFPENGRQGTLTVDGVDYPVQVLDLPSTVESYKTYNDVDLVKTGDVGQLLLVGHPPANQQVEINKVREATGPGAAVESLDGITPPMRSARSRHLRPRMDVPAKIVSQVEEAVIDILDGHAPANTEFEDIEEQYVVDAVTKRGSWKQVVKEKPPKLEGDARDADGEADPPPVATGGTRGRPRKE